MTMQVPKYEWGGENCHAARVVHGQTDNSLRCPVMPSTTIDMHFTGLPSLHFIKCDVEGHELGCIKGAARTLQNAKPTWLIAVSGTFRMLRESGYKTCWVDGTTL